MAAARPPLHHRVAAGERHLSRGAPVAPGRLVGDLRPDHTEQVVAKGLVGRLIVANYDPSELPSGESRAAQRLGGSFGSACPHRPPATSPGDRGFVSTP